MSTPYLNDLERFLDLTALRQGLVAGNIANIDTPHYRTLDINFRDELQRAERAAPGTRIEPLVQPVRGLMQRPDGNNVSMDREAMLLARTQLQYKLGVQLLTREFQRIQWAINGGGGVTS